MPEVVSIILIVVAAVVFVVAVLFAVAMFVSHRLVMNCRVKGDDFDAAAKEAGFDEPYELAETEAFDGTKLAACIFKRKKKSFVTVIVQHGYKADPARVATRAKYFYDKGFNVILPILRGHGASGGRYTSLGYYEKFDILRWVDVADKQFGGSQILYGVSLGGAAVAGAVGGEMPGHVIAAIVECAPSSQLEIVLDKVKNPLARAFVLPAFYASLRVLQGYSIKQADYAEAIKGDVVPTLFIHGSDDGFINIRHSQELFEACGSEYKRFLKVSGARHAKAYEVNAKLCEAAYERLLSVVKLAPTVEGELPEFAPLDEFLLKEAEEKAAAEKAAKEAEEKAAAEKAAKEAEEKAAAEKAAKEAEEKAENESAIEKGKAEESAPKDDESEESNTKADAPKDDESEESSAKADAPKDDESEESDDKKA